MNIPKLYIYIAIITVFLLLGIVWHNSSGSGSPDSDLKHNDNPHERANTVVEKKPLKYAPTTGMDSLSEEEKSVKPNGVSDQAWLATVFYHRKNASEQNGDVTFYGRVIDQESNGIADASITAESNVYVESLKEQIVYGGGKSDRKTLVISTDKNGYFVVSGYRAKDLHFLSVEKAGYISTKKIPSGFVFGKAFAQTYESIARNPVTFSMWKKGNSAGNVKIGQMRFYLHGDGKPNTVSLETGKISGEDTAGDFRLLVECAYDNGIPGNYMWSFGVKPVDGGIIKSTDTYLFIAPETGYEDSIRMQSADSQGSWSNEGSIKFYVKSGNGSRYSAVTAKIITGFNDNEVACDLNWVINIEGKRNLEPPQ